MKKLNTLIVVVGTAIVLALAGTPKVVLAAPDQTFRFEAELTEVDAAAAFFSVGDIVTGSYTFNEPTGSSGSYIDIITAATVTINGLTWTKVTTGGGTGNIFVRDNACCTRDQYQVGINVGPSPTVLGDVGQTLTPKAVFIELSDSGATVFSDTALPLVPPDLSEFEFALFTFRFDDPVNFSDAVIVGVLTSLYVGALPVEIDIKPGSDPNSINLSSAGVIPVAILSSATFDATTVNPDTIFLASGPV